MQIVAPPKERERSFPPAECERVLPLSHSHSTLNGTLSFDAHWPACTQKPTQTLKIHANAIIYIEKFSHVILRKDAGQQQKKKKKKLDPFTTRCLSQISLSPTPQIKVLAARGAS